MSREIYIIYTPHVCYQYKHLSNQNTIGNILAKMPPFNEVHWLPVANAYFSQEGILLMAFNLGQSKVSALHLD